MSVEQEVDKTVVEQDISKQKSVRKSFKEAWREARGYDECLKENIKKIKLLNNKGLWIYVLASVGPLERKDVEKIAEILLEKKDKNKRVPLITIFKEAGINHLPIGDYIFEHTCFDYNLPGKTIEQIKKLSESKSRNGNRFFAAKVADIIGGDWSPVFKDLYGLEGRGEIKIYYSYPSNNPKTEDYKETYHITGSGEETARTTKYLADHFIKPFLFLGNKTLIMTGPYSSKLQEITP